MKSRCGSNLILQNLSGNGRGPEPLTPGLCWLLCFLVCEALGLGRKVWLCFVIFNPYPVGG